MRFSAHFAQYKALKRKYKDKIKENFDSFNSALINLGNPHKKLKCIHVAGTNGKGSVCHMLASVLKEAGCKTGLFISPHIKEPEERISINGQNITPSGLDKYINKVFAAEITELNYFELLTAAAFKYFADKECDICVIETGLGGRLDPTNVCDSIVSVITSISDDHKDVLGGTIKQIAAEKAGIIKDGKACVAGDIKGAALSVIKQTAKDKNAPLVNAVKEYPFAVKKFNWDKNTAYYSYDGKTYSLRALSAAQNINLSIVYAVSKILGLKETAFKKGIAQTEIHGRFEVIKRGKKRFILDGAHNEEAVKTFVKTFLTSPYQKNAAVIFSSMKDKDYKTSLKILSQVFDNFIFYTSPDSRAVSPAALRAEVKKGHVTEAENLEEAVAEARVYDNIFFAGSFYQISEAEDILLTL
ncbi:dihydrofolate synthase / folylpolyglutamate synthase [Parelusimicrobium proximum]|uniref:bifunctional folylpolyglutamate synthase/dihydrofolate synthase n=1 Tax=Parelusimicrobium proximum TaxID=3228953 RepID=UPI003D166FC8